MLSKQVLDGNMECQIRILIFFGWSKKICQTEMLFENVNKV